MQALYTDHLEQNEAAGRCPCTLVVGEDRALMVTGLRKRQHGGDR